MAAAADSLGRRAVALSGKVAVVHTGRGNLLSVCKALDHLGADIIVSEHPDQLAAADRVVLPGVGSFRDSMDHLRAAGFPEALAEVRDAGRPVLGVCLGMQLLARGSTEGGNTVGLGWIPADVRRLEPAGLRVPHVGWNDVHARADSPLFANLRDDADFYFVHSYQVVCDDDVTLDAWCEYGGRMAAAVRHETVAAVQFHPEKSQDHGLAVLDAFLHWSP